MKKFRFGSMCSGIEAASKAWHQLGWETAFVSEIEKFPNAVLGHRLQGVPNLGNMTAPDFIKRAKACGPIDLLVAGTPCQSFSVAGLRKGLTDSRGNLTLRYIEIAHALKPKYLVWENVPGVLSDKTNAFGCLLAGLTGADAPLVSDDRGGKWASAGIATGEKYSVAWRVLDAQHFGVPQRRRRVFLVGYLGDWRGAAKVLFEREGLRGNFAPGVEEREDAPSSVGGRSEARSHWDDSRAPHPTLNQSARGSGGVGASNQEIFSQRGAYLVPGSEKVAKALKARGGLSHDASHETYVTHTLRGEGFDASEDGTGRGVPLVIEPTVFSIMPMNSGKDYKARPVQVSQPLMAAGPGSGNQGGDIVVTRIAVHNTGHGFWKENNKIAGTVRSKDDITSVIAFSSKDHGGDAGAVSPTIRAGGHSESHANAGVPPAVAVFEQPSTERQKILTALGFYSTNRQPEFGNYEERSPAIKVGSGGSSGNPPAVVIPILEAGARTGKSTTDPRAGIGIGEAGDPMYTLQATKQHAVVVPIDMRQASRGGKMTNNRRDGVSGGGAPGTGVGNDGDPSPTIASCHTPAVFADRRAVIAIKDDVTPKTSEGLAFTLTQPSPTGGGHPQAVCYDMRGRGDGKVAPTLLTDHPSRPSDYCPIILELLGDVDPIAFAQNQMGEIRTGKKVGTLNTNANASGRNTPLIFQQNSRSEVRIVGGEKPVAGAVTSEPGAQCQNYVYKPLVLDEYNQTGAEKCYPLRTASGDGTPKVELGSSVRRLTPVECERLQGFPDDHTMVLFNGKPASDGPRYKALGNSMAVPCMAWIGEGIQLLEWELALDGLIGSHGSDISDLL